MQQSLVNHSIVNSTPKGARLARLKREAVADIEREEVIDRMERNGLYDRSLSLDEARKNFINLGLGSIVPNVIMRPFVASTKTTKGVTVIGEGMARVEATASKIPGAHTLNNMPKFTGTAYQITSKMMAYNRQWFLRQLRSGRTILDIGRDLNRTNPSIFYQMEQNMLKNYLKLHPKSLNIVKP